MSTDFFTQRAPWSTMLVSYQSGVREFAIAAVCMTHGALTHSIPSHKSEHKSNDFGSARERGTNQTRGQQEHVSRLTLDVQEKPWSPQQHLVMAKLRNIMLRNFLELRGSNLKQTGSYLSILSHPLSIFLQVFPMTVRTIKLQQQIKPTSVDL